MTYKIFSLIPLLLVGLAGAVQAAEFHVSPAANCDDSGNCGQAKPCCTVQAALEKVKAAQPSAGNIVTIHEGVYPECATYYATNMADYGTQAAPIVIRGAPGEDPAKIIIDASVVPFNSCPEIVDCNDNHTQRAALTLKGDFGDATHPYELRYVRVRDITVRPPNFESQVDHNNGIDLQCVRNIELINIRSDYQPTFSATGSYGDTTSDNIFKLYNTQNVLMQNCDISNGGVIHHGFTAIASAFGADDTLITGCRIRDMSGGWVASSGGTNRSIITFNDVAHIDDGTDGDNGLQQYNVDNQRIAWNRVADHKFYISRFRAYDWMAALPRSIINNNLFQARDSSQTAFDFGYSSHANRVRLALFRNNIFDGYGTAYLFRKASGGSLSPAERPILNCNFVEDYNLYLNVGTIITDLYDPSDPALRCGFSVGLNSIDTNQTPMLHPLDAAGCPMPGSPIIDAGDPKYPVPLGGGNRVDMGACEFGASAAGWITPYDFQTADSTASSTPRITWDGTFGPDINIRNLDFKEYLLGAPQTDYRCQVDSVYTFNSQGISTPLWDSGQVVSIDQFCDVGISLAPGDYFARVQVNETGWSDLFKFSVGSDDGTVPAAPAGLTVQ